MGALGKLFNVIFGRIFSLFGAVVSTKLMLVASAVGTFVIMLAGLTVAFNSLLATISMAMPAEFQWGLGIIPNNIPVCVSAIITARCLLWVFQVKWSIVKLKVSV